MEKNNLEKLYQEKLKNFNEIPNQHVWDSIAASLDKKEKKRVLPIWWKLGGVAALLTIFVYLINPFKENTIPTLQTTDVEKTPNQLPKIIKEDNPFSNETITSDPKTSTEVVTNDENKTPDDTNVIGVKSKKTVSPTANPNSKIVISNSIKNSTQNNTGKIAAADTKNLDANKFKEKQEQIDFKKLKKESNTIGLASSKATNEKGKLKLDPNQDQNNTQLKKEELIAQTTKKDNKKSLFDVIEEQKEEELALAENKSDKWSVGSSVAPVYFDALGQGSPIHPDFVENSKSGNVNLSYGLTVAYNVGKRLKITSGIHKIDYGYDTDEVFFSSSLTQSSVDDINNINFSETSRTIVVGSKREDNTASINRAANGFSGQSLQREGNLSQQIGYLEVPLELNYALIDKKFGLNLIGGLSSLFLVNNSVSLESGGLVTEVGEANNVNSLNFSTNFGLGFSYDFSSKIQLNLEPIFKYQLNTFSNTSGDFNPYALGLYSGIQFKF